MFHISINKHYIVELNTDYTWLPRNYNSSVFLDTTAVHKWRISCMLYLDSVESYLYTCIVSASIIASCPVNLLTINFCHSQPPKSISFGTGFSWGLQPVHKNSQCRGCGE